jgi:hypothetical protein
VQLNASSLSDLRSAVTAFTLSTSDISDLASAVVAGIVSDLSDIKSATTQINSRVLVTQSQASDIYSLVSDLHSDVTNLSGVVSDLTSAVAALPTNVMDLTDGIETSITLRQAIRLILAAEAGKLSGAATTTVTIRNVGDSKNRITATVDSDGNRTAVTTDAT